VKRRASGAFEREQREAQEVLRELGEPRMGQVFTEGNEANEENRNGKLTTEARRHRDGGDF
jgi:hypothetical protein